MAERRRETAGADKDSDGRREVASSAERRAGTRALAEAPRALPPRCRDPPSVSARLRKRTNRSQVLTAPASGRQCSDR